MMGTQGAHVTGAGGRPNPGRRHGVQMMSIQYFLTSPMRRSSGAGR